MTGNFFHDRKSLIAVIGAIFILPAAFLVSIGLMYSFGSRDLADLILNRVYAGEWYWRFSHPAFVLGGLLIALIANSIASLKINNTQTRIAVALEVTRNRWNIAILGIAVALTAVLIAYAFGENLQIGL